MLNFFRKLRNKSLGNPANHKYVRYALGEILLVVAGILIALQINNWNERRKSQAQVKSLLGNLIESVEDDLRWYERIQMVNSFRVNSMIYLLELTGEETGIWDQRVKNPLFDFQQIAGPDSSAIWNRPFPDTLDRELLQLTLLWSSRHVFMNPNLSTMDELKSTGLLSQIKNADLKTEINHYYNELGWNYNPVREEFQAVLGLPWVDMKRKYGLHRVDFHEIDDPLQVFVQNEEITSFMIEIINWAQTRTDLAGRHRRDAITLIEMLKEELGYN